MIRVRLLMIALLLMIPLAACNKSQPSGVPETGALPPSTTPAAQQPAPPPPSPTVAEPIVQEAAPPPLDSPIEPYEKTGYPDCDEYIEAYRQCLNTRLGSDERKPKATELHNSVRAILRNISRGTDPARVAALCKKARGLAANKLSALGCAL